MLPLEYSLLSRPYWSSVLGKIVFISQVCVSFTKKLTKVYEYKVKVHI